MRKKPEILVAVLVIFVVGALLGIWLTRLTTATWLIYLEIASVLFLGYTALLYYLNRTLLQPVEQITAKLEAISKGDLDIEIDKDLREKNNDIGKLAASVNRMLASFKLAYKKTEPVLQEEKEKLEKSLSSREAVLDATEDGILVVDNDGNIVTYNDKFMEIWELPEDIIETRSDEKALQIAREKMKDPDQFYKDVQEIYQTGREDHTVIEFKDGRLIKRHGRPQMLDGNKIGYVWSFRDITEQERRQYELETSEARYRRLFETAEDGILIIDPETRLIQDANPYIQNILGYSKKEIVGKTLWDIGFSEDVVESKELFTTLTEEGGVRYEHIPLETKNGEERDVEFISTLYEVGHTPTIQCNIRDITIRKRLENNLRTIRLLYEKLYEKAPVAYFLITGDGIIEKANKKAADLLDYGTGELAGKHIEDLYHSESAEKLQTMLDEFVAKDRDIIANERLDMVSQSGETVPIFLNVAPSIDENGNITRRRSIAIGVPGQN